MDPADIKWMHKMTGRLIREAREHLGLTRRRLGLLSGLATSIKKIEEAEDREPVMAITDHKLRVFFASAGVAFLEDRMVVVHEWDGGSVDEVRALAPPGQEGKRRGREKGVPHGPRPDEWKARNYKTFLRANKAILDKFTAGDALASIAADYGMTKERVRQIAKKAGLPARRGPKSDDT